MVQQAIEQKGSYLKSYLRVGGWGYLNFWGKGRRVGSLLLTSSDVPGFQLISSQLKELLEVVQLLLSLELRELLWLLHLWRPAQLQPRRRLLKAGKEKKKKKRRGREGDSIVFCTYLQTC